MSKVVKSGGYRCSYRSHKNPGYQYGPYTGIRVAHTWIPGKPSVRGAVWAQKTGEQYLGRRFSYYPHLWSSYRGFRLACAPHHPRRFVVRGGCWDGSSLYTNNCHRRFHTEHLPKFSTISFRLACAPHHTRLFVVRGGCWFGNSMYLRGCYRRSFSEHRLYLSILCFRLACDVE